MKFVINNLMLTLDEDTNQLVHVAAKKLKVPVNDIVKLKVIKESVDARKKDSIFLVYSVLVDIPHSNYKITNSDVKLIESDKSEKLAEGCKTLVNRPVVAGSGPAGLFAALVLAQNGYKPLILERGECVEKRAVIVEHYWKTGELNPETNIQFGEGGAGTFSDGKLTTRINDRNCEKVLEEFYKAGAHEEILFKAKPHIGSDVLKKVIVNIRKTIESLGGEFLFNSKVTSIQTRNSSLIGLTINDEQKIDASVLILAIGHSARDTFEMLLNHGIKFVQKPFSIGVRIEHPQELINRAQYGKFAGHRKLGSADYQLYSKIGDRTVYSFCMCPGGVVVASASEPLSIVTNGMSEFLRDRENANSALVVSVNPGDYGSFHPLAGVEFQRIWERLAFKVGGSKGAAPVQRLGDFIDGIDTGLIGAVRPSYTGEFKVTDINQCLPGFVTKPMKQALSDFDRKIRGFALKDSVLTGVETRTSSPVRIPRSECLEALGMTGLYPAGEGAGYAGGIVSAAVDGIRVAEKIISVYTQPAR